MSGQEAEIQDRRFKHKELWFLIGCTLAAALIRAYLLRRTNEYYADSFMRALQSFEWSRQPVWITCAYWVPGATYLGGIFNWLVGNPLYAVRILSLVAGTLSVPCFYLAVRAVFGIFAACLSAVLLTCLPLHCGLSASSLSEGTYVFFLLTAVLLTINSATICKDLTTRRQPLSDRIGFLSCILTLMALTMIRNESWLLIPCFVVYYLAKSGNIARALFLSGALVTFPLYWLVSCQLQCGMAFLSFNGCRAPYCKDIGPLAGLAKVIGMLCLYLGPVTLILALSGAVMRIYALATRPRSSKASDRVCEQALWFSLASICFLVDLFMAWKLGPMFAERYLLPLMILLLPLPALALDKYLQFSSLAAGVRERKQLTYQILGILFVVNSTLLTFMALKPLILVTTERFTDLESLANWLKESGNVSRPILMTSMANRHDLLPLICHENSSNFLVCKDFFTSQENLQKRLAKTVPELFVTDVGDGADLSYLLRAVEFALAKEPLYKNGKILVYRIIPGSLKLKSPIETSLSVWGPANPAAPALDRHK